MILSNKTEKELLVIGLGKIENANDICSFFQQFSEVSFCNWQDKEVIENLIISDNSTILIARYENSIVGMLCGGVLGSRATVNHIAVKQEFRNSNIARKLLIKFEKYSLSKKTKRVFCFVHENNQSGMKFWQSQGFIKTRNEVTLEKDLF